MVPVFNNESARTGTKSACQFNRLAKASKVTARHNDQHMVFHGAALNVGVLRPNVTKNRPPSGDCATDHSAKTLHQAEIDKSQT
jgi:hypothetical protein